MGGEWTQSEDDDQGTGNEVAGGEQWGIDDSGERGGTWPGRSETAGQRRHGEQHDNDEPAEREGQRGGTEARQQGAQQGRADDEYSVGSTGTRLATSSAEDEDDDQAKASRDAGHGDDGGRERRGGVQPVSYTHLTLPTIYPV